MSVHEQRSAIGYRPSAVGQIADIVLTIAVIGAAGVGWLGLILAQTGHFSGRNLAMSITALAVAGLSYCGLRNSDCGIAGYSRKKSEFRIPKLVLSPSMELRTSLVEVSEMVIVAGLLVMAATLYTPPADYAPAFLDAGWYTNAGGLVARTGSLTSTPLAFSELSPSERRLFVRSYADFRRVLPQFPEIENLGFYDVTFVIDSTAGSQVGPYHPPGFSVWIAIAGAHATVLFALLTLLAVYATGRALFGPNVGLVATILLAISPPFLYYARTPFAEMAAAAFLWAGIHALVRFAARQHRWHAAMAGLAFGMALLMKIESWLVLLPLTLLWSHWGCQRRASLRDLLTFLLPLSLAIGHAILLALTVTRPYVILNGYGLMRTGMGMVGLAGQATRPWVWTAFGFLVSAVLLGSRLLHHRSARAAGRQFKALVRPVLTLAVLTAASLSFFAWPALIPGASLPALSQLGLFLTPLGVWLGILGFAQLVYAGSSARTQVIVVFAGTVGLMTLAAPTITENVSPLYAVRRQIPLVVPLLNLLGAFALLSWAGLSPGREKDPRRQPAPDRRAHLQVGGGADLGGLHRVWLEWMCRLEQLLGLKNTRLKTSEVLTGDTPLSSGCAPRPLRYAIFLAVLSLIAFNHLALDRPWLASQELAGSSVFVNRLARRFGPQAVVVFEGMNRGSHVGRFAAPLWAGHGVNALVLAASPPPARQLASAMERWRRRGRSIYFVSQADQPPFDLPGYRWELVGTEPWIGVMAGTGMQFSPESQTLQLMLYLYEVQRRIP